MRLVVIVTLLAVVGCSKPDRANAGASDDLHANQKQVPAPVAPPGPVASTDEAGESACKQLAQATRDCVAGKPCQQADPTAIGSCYALMQARGLKHNPY